MSSSHSESNPSLPKRPRVNLLVVMFVIAAIAFVLGLITQPDAIMQREQPTEATDQSPMASPEDDSQYTERRRKLVDQLEQQGITDKRVLRAMKRVPRHEFVPPAERHRAYRDTALPIAHDQTISQPYIVAIMTQLVSPHPNARALDVGTGSGYQAAVLAEVVEEVHSIEILCDLADAARTLLRQHGYVNVSVTCGDGYQGLPDKAPFDVIIVAAAADHVPEALIQQLAPGGRLIMPVGDEVQQLQLIEKSAEGIITKKNVEAVRFVPMTGQAEQARP